jgi:hypothetical protein
MRKRTLQIFTLLALTCATAFGGGTGGFGLTVLVDESPREQYFHDGTRYVEALRGASYSLRLTNPTPYRVAVALSVDGLNTINARHTDPRSAAKWVLGPYETAVISGWQVNDRTARSFYFTGERNSYGAALGQTDNLGVIEAVFFRERRPRMSTYSPHRSEAAPRDAGAAPPAASAAPQSMEKSDGLSDEYAATGMGGRKRHEVESVDIDLEPEPAASVRIRYEFRPQLVKLGVLPSLTSPLDRRERARGFSEYCPEPK